MRAAGMALLGFLAVTWCVADALLGLTIPPAETVSVPALVGLSEDAAGAYAFLDVTAVYRNDDSPAGTILAQEPVAGSRRKLSGGQLPVRLTVSLGRAEAQIPVLAGEDAKAAAGALRVLGFTVKTVRLPGGVPETVDRTEPPAGESAAVGTVVTLFVCAGESVRTVAVPNLIGMTRGEAILTALRAGLSVGDVPLASPGDVVLSQSPAPGSIVPAGGRVAVDLGRRPWGAAPNPA